MNSKSEQEQHPLLPSGEWEGFYKYPFDGLKHEMRFLLHFQDQTITGSGSDDVGSFSWVGTYDLQSMTCKMTKFYHGRHTVAYDGYIDENGIWGHWNISGFGDGFHIWPTEQTNQNENQEEEVAEKKITLSDQQ